jgi:mercuric reductase
MARSTLLSKEDAQISEELCQALINEGMNVKLNCVPQSINYSDNEFKVVTGHETLFCDQVLVATGRQSNADSLNLESTGVEVTENKNIIVNEYCQTNISSIYAVGDCTTMPQYVYVAAAAGTRAAKNIMGGKVKLDLNILPTVVFTTPQVATVGLTEQQAKQQKINVISRSLPIENVPRAIANMDTVGFIKLIANQDTKEIIGCQILASEAGEIIQTATLAIQNKMTYEQLSNQLFPYLTLVEGLKLTAQTFDKDISQLSCCAG